MQYFVPRILANMIRLIFQNERAWTKGPLQAEIDPLDLEPEDVITSFDYLMEKEALIVGTSSGLLLLHIVDGKETEVVGRVEGGVKCISPSPDGDLLGVTTGFGQLLVMTHDWDLLYETTLEDHPEGVDVRKDFSSLFSDFFLPPFLSPVNFFFNAPIRLYWDPEKKLFSSFVP